MLRAKSKSEMWKRVVLWVIIVLQASIISMGWRDYQYMDYQFRLFRAGLIDDIIGHNYCDSYTED